MNLVYLTSPKGGTGRTTLTANLAFALQRLGHQVVVLDLDVQNTEATNSVINNEAYRDKYDGKDNPYIPLYEQLAANGVEVIVCGQSLNLYGHDKSKVIPQVKVATSALTAVSTFQLRGYAYFKWD